MEFLILWGLFGLIGAAIGGAGGRNSAGLGCILGALLGPIGWLVSYMMDGDRKKCPFCRSLIDKHARVCARCGRDI